MKPYRLSIKFPHYRVSGAWKDGDHKVVMGTLQYIQEDAIRLNKNTFGNLFIRKRRIKTKLNGVHQSIEFGASHSLAILERDLRKEYNDILHHEELFWF